MIIIDLRLNPEKEDIDNEMIKPTEFSGYKLIDEFLKKNEGYQIIVSTASNKIWNVNAALKRGATSYYIKESPEFNYSISETKKNYNEFKTNVQNCFERSYLKVIYKDIQLLIQKLDKLHYPPEFRNKLKNQLDLSFTMLQIASKNNIQLKECPSSEKTRDEKLFAYAFISLQSIIETMSCPKISLQ